MFDKYEVELTLTRDMLGTNPLDANIHDVHILNKQRELILEKSKINTTVNKYLGQLEISKEKGEAEVQKIVDRLEETIGRKFTDEERQDAIAGKLTDLKETLSEMDSKGTTVFFWDKETDYPCIGDHMIYGFLKAASEAIGRTLPRKNGVMLQSMSYTQSIINQHVRCEEQFIPFDRDLKRDEQGKPFYLQRSLRGMTPQGPRISLAKSEVVEAGARLRFGLKVMKDSPLTYDILRKLFSYGEMVGLGQWRNAGNGMFVSELMKVQ